MAAVFFFILRIYHQAHLFLHYLVKVRPFFSAFYPIGFPYAGGLHDMSALHIHLRMGHCIREQSLVKIRLFHILQLHGPLMIRRFHNYRNGTCVLLLMA